MKILLSAYACEPGRGSESDVGWNWAVELARLGHSVTVLTRTNNRSVIEAEMSKAADRTPNILQFSYYDLPRWARWWKKGGRGVQLYYQLWQIGAYFHSRSLTKDAPFDLVHHVTFGVFRQASWLGNLGLPFVIGPVGGGENTPNELLATYPFDGRFLEYLRRFANSIFLHDPAVRRMLRQASLILCRNKQTLNLIPRRFRHKCILQPEVGISESWIAKTTNVPRKPEFLFAGRLLYLKGIHLALAALAQARKACPEMRLTIVGQGPHFRWLWLRAKKLGISEAVVWREWMPHQELKEQYHNSLAMVFPSLRDSGGTVVRECLAAGTPVICVNTGGPAEIVTDEVGFRVEPLGKSPDELIHDLAQAMLTMANNQELTMRLSRNALELSKARNWSIVVSDAYVIIAKHLNIRDSVSGFSASKR